MNNWQSKADALWCTYGVVWREQTDYDDCYFCQTNVYGFNKNNKTKIKYPLSVKSDNWPVPHIEGVPVPVRPTGEKFQTLESAQTDDNDKGATG